MLGRLRRTTRLDVGLALAFSGISYLVWALVAGTSREMVRAMMRAADASTAPMVIPHFSHTVKVFFSDMGIIIDVVGLAWMVLSLLLVVYAGRQRLSISWAWLSAIVQSFTAALGGVLVGWAMNLPYQKLAESAIKPEKVPTVVKVSEMSLWILLTVAILIWVIFLVWLVVERAHLRARGPSLRDGLKSNVYP
jgi:hypothetical protein